MITEDRAPEYEAAIRKDVPRNVFVEVKSLFETAALQANAAVSASQGAVPSGLSLTRHRQSRSVGLIRYNLIDQAFEDILTRHEAEFIKAVPVEFEQDEPSLVPVHLTTGVFGGTIIGFASHRDALDTPTKNATRRALCFQNRGLSPDFFHPPEMFIDRQRLVLIMVQRDPVALGKIASLKLCILDSKQERFIFQADINDFLAGYGSSNRAAPKRKVGLKNPKSSFKNTVGPTANDGKRE
ncbi:MAG: hypothetical protein AAFQ10_13030 [Pseudomonadota bacterium]